MRLPAVPGLLRLLVAHVCGPECQHPDSDVDGTVALWTAGAVLLAVAAFSALLVAAGVLRRRAARRKPCPDCGLFQDWERVPVCPACGRDARAGKEPDGDAQAG